MVKARRLVRNSDVIVGAIGTDIRHEALRLFNQDRALANPPAIRELNPSCQNIARPASLRRLALRQTGEKPLEPSG